MKRNDKVKISIVVLMLVTISVIALFMHDKKNLESIDQILAGEAYAYLPQKAKNYVKDTYDKTGEVILTEKNKKENRPYLNPQYVKYLEMSEEEKKEEDAIPPVTVVDYSFNEEVNANVPTSYDLRSVNGKNFVTPVRAQGNLGICWAFAAAGSMESHLLVTNNESYN